jgi:hypothetical protein
MGIPSLAIESRLGPPARLIKYKLPKDPTVCPGLFRTGLVILEAVRAFVMEFALLAWLAAAFDGAQDGSLIVHTLLFRLASFHRSRPVRLQKTSVCRRLLRKPKRKVTRR